MNAILEIIEFDLIIFKSIARNTYYILYSHAQIWHRVGVFVKWRANWQRTASNEHSQNNKDVQTEKKKHCVVLIVPSCA